MWLSIREDLQWKDRNTAADSICKMWEMKWNGGFVGYELGFYSWRILNKKCFFEMSA